MLNEIPFDSFLFKSWDMYLICQRLDIFPFGGQHPEPFKVFLRFPSGGQGGRINLFKRPLQFPCRRLFQLGTCFEYIAIHISSNSIPVPILHKCLRESQVRSFWNLVLHCSFASSARCWELCCFHSDWNQFEHAPPTLMMLLKLSLERL